MSIIAFWSKEDKETGQSLSQVALTTYMAVMHNNKILNISTAFNDKTLDDCYWFQNASKGQDTLGAGIEGLIKVINSNKTSYSIVSNYSKIIYKDRLDVLASPRTTNFDEYKEICKMYKEIIKIANNDYDYVFVDLYKDMPEEEKKTILEMADIIVVNVSQRLKVVNDLYRLRVESNFFSKNNIMINIGRYDRFSKYNITNIARFIGERKSKIYSIPYNTLYSADCSEGKVAEFFTKFYKITDPEDRNAYFISEIDRFVKALIYRLQELQMERNKRG